MELVIEEFGQAFLAMIVMGSMITILFNLIANEGFFNEWVLAYMQSICG